MDKWEKIIREKSLESRPFEPRPDWDKMGSLLDEHLPLDEERKNPRPLFWFWLGAAVLFGFAFGWGLNSYLSKGNIQPEQESRQLVSEEVRAGSEELRVKRDELGVDSEELEVERDGLGVESKNRNFERIPANEGSRTLGNIKENLSVEALTISPIAVEEHSEDAVWEVNSMPAPITGISGGTVASGPQPEVIPSYQPPQNMLSIGSAEVNLTKAGEDIKRYASLTGNAVSLVLGSGANQKWARSKWAINLHSNVNRIPLEPMFMSTGGNDIYFYYSPVMPGAGLDISYRPNHRWEFGIRGDADGIWYPLELTPDNPDDYTDLFGTGFELGVFSRRYFTENRRKRFRPFMTATTGMYIMDMQLTRFEGFGQIAWEPDSWNARKKEPEQSFQFPDFEVMSTSVNYKYLSAGVGLGVDIRLYRRLSFTYQSTLYGNLRVSRTKVSELEDFRGYNYLWKNSFGLTLALGGRNKGV